MDSAVYQLSQKDRVPVIYQLHRWFFAACIILGTASALVTVAANPGYYSSHNGPAAFIAAFATTNAVMAQTHLITMVLTAYLLPLSLLAMAWLAMRRSPWLASSAALVVLLGVLPLGVFAGQDALTYDLARMGGNPSLVTIAQQFNNDGMMTYYNIVFNLGMILGPTWVGVVLWRVRAIPVWAAILITLSRPLVFLYPFIPSLPGIYIQIPSCVFLFIGSIPAAIAMIKTPGAESQPAQGRAARQERGRVEVA